MCIKEIITEGNPILRNKSALIDQLDEEVLTLARDLRDTLYSTKGIGLSAPQIGVLKRMILINIHRGKREILLINPRIVLRRGSSRLTEGCLSCPGKIAVVDRPESIMVVGRDLKWKNRAIKCTGILARAISHEIDHLNGILMMDNAIQVKSNMA